MGLGLVHGGAQGREVACGELLRSGGGERPEAGVGVGALGVGVATLADALDHLPGRGPVASVGDDQDEAGAGDHGGEALARAEDPHAPGGGDGGVGPGGAAVEDRLGPGGELGGHLGGGEVVAPPGPGDGPEDGDGERRRAPQAHARGHPGLDLHEDPAVAVGDTGGGQGVVEGGQGPGGGVALGVGLGLEVPGAHRHPEGLGALDHPGGHPGGQAGEERRGALDHHVLTEEDGLGAGVSGHRDVSVRGSQAARRGPRTLGARHRSWTLAEPVSRQMARRPSTRPWRNVRAPSGPPSR